MITLHSGCKLNLGLRVHGLRPDGCHELETVFYPLAWPRDDIFIKNSSGTGCEIAPTAGIRPEDNLIAKAWTAYAKATGFAPALGITLRKRVPTGSGLGGGSANAGVILNWLNNQAPRPLASAELANIAAGIGADVPFFIYNSPCRATGKGDVIKPLRIASKKFFIILVSPGIPISTAWAFRQLDLQKSGSENCLTKAPTDSNSSNSVEILQAGSIDLRNDLEMVVFAEYPELPALKHEILNLGAHGAAMSGSGSSLYGIFSSQDAARSAAISLRAKWPQVYCLPMCSHAGV